MKVTSPELDRLVETGLLQREPPLREEYEGLIESATRRIHDAGRPGISLDGRFDLGYNAAHALALAALRRAGYRTTKRYIVFQALEHTLGLPAARWRLLASCHAARNRIEYEGDAGLDEQRVTDLLAIARDLLAMLRALPAPEEAGE